MNREVVMIIRKSAIDKTLEELIDVIIERKLLVRIVEDEEFEQVMKFYNKEKIEGMVEER